MRHGKHFFVETGDENAVTVTAYRDGPYLVRGPFTMLDQEGNQILLERPTVALCRCGKSRVRPLCDGTHRLVGFRAPSSAEQWPPGPPRAPDAQTSAPRGAQNGLAGAADMRRRPSPPGSSAASSDEHAFAGARRPDGMPQLPSAARELRQAVGQLARTEQLVARWLRGPLRSDTYTALSLAEPLMGAARRLLEWVLGEVAGVADGGPRQTNGHGGAPVDLDACRRRLESVSATIHRAGEPGDRALRQARALLEDAVGALRA